MVTSRSTLKALLLVGGALAVCLSQAAAAGPAATVVTEHVTATLQTESTSLVPGATLNAILSLDIIDGWHTYWKNPGDSGEATRIEWTLPEGVSAGDIQWTTPHRIPYSGFVNFGYEGVADHLVSLRADAGLAPGQTATIVAEATWLVCEDICIPETGRFELALPVAATADPRPAAATEFDRARRALPSDAGTVAARADGDDVVIDLGGLPQLTSAYFFPNDWGVTEPGAEQILTDNELRLVGVRFATAPVGGVLRGVTATGAPIGTALRAALDAAPAPNIEPADSSPGLLTALAFALLGGLILNLMPCVFPVLSMKAMHLIHSAHDADARRTEGLAYTAGVLVFFALLGVGVLLLRAGGTAVGWGFQLQSPPVVGVLALLMFLVGLNLLGAFEIGGRFAGAGQSLAGRGGAVGAFFTGALAAVVATPCTAPFMGVALGFALAQPAPIALAVLLTLGLGLALPFLLIALVPAVAARLPRPGAWMNTLRQLLAFPMFAAAIWLAWVLTLQAGADGMLRLLSAALIAALGVWLWPRRAKLAVGALCAIAALASAATVLTLSPQTGPTTAKSDARGVAFTPDALARARAAGQTVFVNQTAAWCLTCLVNEKNVLSAARVDQALRAPGVTYMSGDWTRRDPDITEFLTRHGRSGVPLYVVYHGEQAGTVLPPVLTESIVLDALTRP